MTIYAQAREMAADFARLTAAVPRRGLWAQLTRIRAAARAHRLGLYAGNTVEVTRTTGAEPRPYRVLDVIIAHDGEIFASAVEDDPDPARAHWSILKVPRRAFAIVVSSRWPKFCGKWTREPADILQDLRHRDREREETGIYCRLDLIPGLGYVVSTRRTIDNLGAEIRLFGPDTRAVAIAYMQEYDARSEAKSKALREERKSA